MIGTSPGLGSLLNDAGQVVGTTSTIAEAGSTLLASYGAGSAAAAAVAAGTASAGTAALVAAAAVAAPIAAAAAALYGAFKLIQSMDKSEQRKAFAAQQGQYETANGELINQNFQLNNKINELNDGLSKIRAKLKQNGLAGFSSGCRPPLHEAPCASHRTAKDRSRW